MAAQNFGLPLQTSELTLTGQAGSVSEPVIGEIQRRVPWAGCFEAAGGQIGFEGKEAFAHRFEAELHFCGVLPLLGFGERDQSGNGLRLAVEVGRKCEQGFRRGLTVPALGKNPLQRILHVVVGEPGGATGEGQKTGVI